jgi:hypothetical protein
MPILHANSAPAEVLWASLLCFSSCCSHSTPQTSTSKLKHTLLIPRALSAGRTRHGGGLPRKEGGIAQEQEKREKARDRTAHQMQRKAHRKHWMFSSFLVSVQAQRKDRVFSSFRVSVQKASSRTSWPKAFFVNFVNPEFVSSKCTDKLYCDLLQGTEGWQVDSDGNVFEVCDCGLACTHLSGVLSSTLYNSLTKSNSYTMKKVLHVDMQLRARSNDCWPSHNLSTMDGLTQSYIFKQKLQNCEPIDLSRLL